MQGSAGVQPGLRASVSTVVDARRAGVRSMLWGAVAVAATLGLVALGSALGWANVMVSGTALLLGWIVLGFGVGETLFAGRFRVATMLLALVIGIAGMAFSFWAIRALGFTLAA